MNNEICQIQSVHQVTRNFESSPSLYKRLRLLLSRLGVGKTKRRVIAYMKMSYTQVRKRIIPAAQGEEISSTLLPIATFQAGDRVRIRSFEEIQATLDNHRKLKGCQFMPGMQTYCGTSQRVFKVLKRFVDERDYEVKRCRDLYLIEGLMCQGTEQNGRCDRSCLYFWRGEWLEKIENSFLTL